MGATRVVVTDVGDGAPAASEVNYIPFHGGYARNADAVDIWMMSPDGNATVNEDGGGSVISSIATWYQGPLSVNV